MELNEYVVRLFGTIDKVESLKLFGDCTSLSRTEVRLLREVIVERAKGKDIISSELARRLGITRSAVSQLVTKLEERDIVVRTAAPDDRKIAYIRLSDKTSAAFDELCQKANVTLATTAERFGRDRVQRLSVDCDDFLALLKQVSKENKAEAEPEK